MTNRYDSLLDAAARLISRGYKWNADYQRFERSSWSAHLIIQRNGRCRVVFT